VVVIIGIGQLGAGGEDGLGKVIVLVFILGLLPLEIPDRFYITIGVVIIDVAKLLLKQLDAVKVNGVGIEVILQL